MTVVDTETDSIAQALANARRTLLDARTPAGHWVGELSSSALSTATATFALWIAKRNGDSAGSALRTDTSEAVRNADPTRNAYPILDRLIRNGAAWLACHQNGDGGWGDTIDSISNISTTALCWAALSCIGESRDEKESFSRATAWLARAIESPKSAPLAAGQRPCGSSSSDSPVEEGPPGRCPAANDCLDPAQLAEAIARRYGNDRTFSVPILTCCALAGRLGPDASAWKLVPQLPFELAALPQSWFRFARLPVVSYALPALIGIGHVRHHRRPTRNPIARLARWATHARTLHVLQTIQPQGGGFLEATPLTSFVVMSLAGAGQARHPVVAEGIGFLLRSARPDGSWPIDTNLATWVTTLSINALAHSPCDWRGVPFAGTQKEDTVTFRYAACHTESSEGSPPSAAEAALRCAQGDGLKPSDYLNPMERKALRDWLIGQQYRVRHPYTGAAPGGWAWTDLPGGVPDADDTAGALLALHHLGDVDQAALDAGNAGSPLAPSRPVVVESTESRRRKRQAEIPPQANTRCASPMLDAVRAGIRWLLDLQNRDGGIPTFCRGWGKLPFDRSAPDLTAHALLAFKAWRDRLPLALATETDRAAIRAIEYLRSSQRPDGSWVPLWFGNQAAADDENPTYGTARVVAALIALGDDFPVGQTLPAASLEGAAEMAGSARPAHSSIQGALDGGLRWLLSAQNPDGAWGGAPGVRSSVEETGPVIVALSRALNGEWAQRVSIPIARGSAWLAEKTRGGRSFPADPIGLYFAKLWYSERLYPVIAVIAALGAARGHQSA